MFSLKKLENYINFLIEDISKNHLDLNKDEIHGYFIALRKLERKVEIEKEIKKENRKKLITNTSLFIIVISILFVLLW